MGSGDFESRLQAVEAHIDISQLVARYALAADSRDIETLVKLFVPELRATWHPWIEATLRTFRRSIHQIFGHRIDLDPDDPGHATGTLYCRAEHEFDDRWVVMAICYFDDYRLFQGEWLFGAIRQPGFWYARDLREPPQSVGFNSWHEVVVNPNAPDDEGYRPTLPEAFPTWTPFWNPNS